jgi:dipeptidase E
MNLYLSSYRIPTPEDVYDLAGTRKPVCALIENAKDYKPDDEREFKLQETTSYLIDLGFSVTRFDLRKDSDISQLAGLDTYNCLFVAGGNTFTLRQAMFRSGFDHIVQDLLNRGVVYIGESAGAIVAGRTLKGTETADELSGVDQVIWEGLRLIDKIFVPHADNSEFQDYVEKMKKLYREDEGLVLLNDNQAYIVQDENWILTESKS